MTISSEVATTLTRRSIVVLLLTGLIGALLLLSGCGGALTEEIWLRSGERWEIQATVSLGQSEYAMFGSDLEEGFAELEQGAPAKGVSVDWSRREDSDGRVTYTIRMEGQGLDKLNEVAFEGDATISKDASGHIHLTWLPASMSALGIYTLTIHGGSIISNNADEETSSSATWHNPSGPIELEITERRSPIVPLLAAGMACICVTGLVIAGGALVLVLLRRKKQ
jgi:hypothetical protein